MRKPRTKDIKKLVSVEKKKRPHEYLSQVIAFILWYV